VEAGARVTEVIDQLIALFNARSLDLPDGVFRRQTQFLLNGVPYENLLGRAPDDPLVLMLARGPAGYRFMVKALQHAIPDGQVQRGELTADGADGRAIVTGQLWISGHYRGTGEPAEILTTFELCARGGALERAAVQVDAATLAKIKDARLRS
jgi:hypothetical protein